MNKKLIALLIYGASQGAFALDVLEPAIEKAHISIHSPDSDVKTLGKVEIIIDLGAGNDSLLDLKIRRAGLKLTDGKNLSAFGYNKERGVIVIAADPVTHISVTGVQGKNILATFYDAKNQIIAPNKNDVRVFDLDMKPITIKYEPAQPPGALKMNVSILIDHSGSMLGHIDEVLTATRMFMTSLPTFAHCSVYAFSTTVETLTQGDAPCPSSLYALNKPIQAEGATALFGAIEQSLKEKRTPTPGLPRLLIVVTDGMDTQGGITLGQLIALKKSTNARVFTFWAGSFDPAYLKGLADYESSAAQNIQTDLNVFFSAIGVSVSGLQTLTMI